MSMKRALAVIGFVLFAGCTGVPAAAVRDWSNNNFKSYRKLVDDKYAGADHEDTRLNAYQSMSALVCDADTADKKQDDSKACKCQHATGEAVKTTCATFIQDYPAGN